MISVLGLVGLVLAYCEVMRYRFECRTFFFLCQLAGVSIRYTLSLGNSGLRYVLTVAGMLRPEIQLTFLEAKT